jgi:hypothetical protein
MKNPNCFQILALLVLAYILATDSALAQIAPTIVEHPQNVIVPYGGTASFSVIAEGTPPFSYRWRSNGFTVATILTNVYSVSNATQTAFYDVAVMNAHGQRLTRRGLLSLFNYQLTQNGLDLTLSSLYNSSTTGTNYVYEIQHKTDLAATNWNVWTNLALPQPTVTFQAWSLTNAPQGFFRILLWEQ